MEKAEQTLIEAVQSDDFAKDAETYVLMSMPDDLDNEGFYDLQIRSKGDRKVIEVCLIEAATIIFGDMYKNHRFHSMRPLVFRLRDILQSHTLVLMLGVVIGITLVRAMS